MGFANSPKNVFDRFSSPRIDDPALPLSDVLIAQIVAPSLEVFWLTSNHAAMPTWLSPLSQSLFAIRGSLVAPTLIHGAGLACCWIAGALAAKAYEVKAFDVSENNGYGNVLLTTIKAGAFATGLLLLASQMDLYLEFGRIVHLGDSEEIDIRLLQSIVELINDIIFEAGTLLTWRFLSPRIDDPALPLSDVLIAQIVAPSLEVFWLTSNHAAMPTWLSPLSQSLFAIRGSLVAPTLIHGAGLACCWIAGALAAKAYEVKAFDVSENNGYGNVLLTTIKAGAFATGLLLLASQMDLYLEFGRIVHLGDSEEIDIRLLQSIVELINDIIFEAGTLLTWRFAHAKSLSTWK